MDKSERIIREAEKAGREHTPYSKFRVGAALLTQDSSIYTMQRRKCIFWCCVLCRKGGCI